MKIKSEICWMAGGAVFAGSMIAASYVMTKLLVDAALDRNTPGIMKNAGRFVSGKKKNDTSGEIRRLAGERLRNRETETVMITSSDGTALVGHLYPAKGKTERVIIAMHGWRSAWYRDFGMIADFWHDHGCSVLYAEQRGQGGSGGNCMGFGVLERYDCLDWSYWVQKRFDSEIPVYLCGISMGATAVLMATGLELPCQVRGVIADCGFTSPEEIWRHVTEKNLHLAYEPHRRLTDSIVRKKLHVGAGDISSVDALRTAKIPVLFIHGTEDRFVPVSMTYQNYLACRSAKRLLIVPGAAHGMSYSVDKEAYEREVSSFWHDYDTDREDCIAKSDLG